MRFKYINKRRILGTVLAAIGMLFAFSNFSYARVTGAVCSTCHTMHNSQNGSMMRLGTGSTQGAGAGECLDCHGATRAVLLRMDCLGCHAQNLNGSSNIAQPGNMPQIALNAPIPPTNPPDFLAGGNYKYVFYDDRNGHNVHGFGPIIGADLGNNPPGFKSDYDPSFGKYQPGQDAGQVMCAGQNGCHGNRDQISPILAMKGTHHADDSMLKFGPNFTESRQGGGTGGTSDFTTAGKSYRFLYNVHGAEDANWEGVNPSSTVHNEYKGTQFSSRGQTQGWSDVTTISDLCAECHGKFHAGGPLSGDSGIGSASPWLRHPTDVVLPASGEYTAYTTYSIQAPIARQNITDGTTQSSLTVTPGTDVVMCLSCHRAHASPYPDILRWDYSTMIAGGGGSGGCFTCHSKKPTNNP